MNNNIKKLAELACKFSDHEIESIPNAFLEEFAQLIAKQCMNLVETTSYAKWVEAGDERDFFCITIKEYFGVTK